MLWNTIYIEAALEQLRQGAQSAHEEDVARLSPLIYDHTSDKVEKVITELWQQTLTGLIKT